MLTFSIKAVRRDCAEYKVNLRQRRAWFEGTGNPEGGDPPSPPAPTPPAPTPPPAKPTAAEIQAAKEAAVADLLKAAGVKTVEELTASVKAAKDAETAGQTELQRVQGSLTDVQGKLAQAAEEAARLTTALAAEKQGRINDRRDAAIKAAATNKKAIDVTDVLEHATKLPDHLAKTVKEDGSIDDAAVVALVEEVKKAKPHFFTNPKGTPSLQGGRITDDKQKIREGSAGQRRAFSL